MRVLVVDPELTTREALQQLLNLEGFACDIASSGQEALNCLELHSFDLMIAEIRLNDAGRTDLFDKASSLATPPLTIAMANYLADEDDERAVSMAHDFILRPFEPDELLRIVTHVVERERLRKKFEVSARDHFPQHKHTHIKGTSSAIEQVIDLINRVGPTDATVMITGESGTGKELAARALHDASSRCKGPFVPVVCSAIPETLQESELFGHARGAFTGAHTDKVGLLEAAHGGTLFLDEVGELSHGSQVKMLRFLQEREIRRVGETQARNANVRIISATNIDVRRAVKQGQLRQDLFYRLNIVNIHLPSLRERREDIPALTAHFLYRYTDHFGLDKPPQVSGAAMRSLETYDWPGNVRELENAIARAMVLCSRNRIEAEDLPPEIVPVEQRVLGQAHNKPMNLAELEREYILANLEKYGGSRRKTAETLGIPLTTLWRRLRSYGVISPHDEPEHEGIHIVKK